MTLNREKRKPNRRGVVSNDGLVESRRKIRIIIWIIISQVFLWEHKTYLKTAYCSDTKPMVTKLPKGPLPDGGNGRVLIGYKIINLPELNYNKHECSNSKAWLLLL